MRHPHHPYRGSVDGTDHDADGRFEELVLAFVLVVSGAIGVLIGAARPHTSSYELVLGAFLVVLGTSTAIRRRRA